MHVACCFIDTRKANNKLYILKVGDIAF